MAQNREEEVKWYRKAAEQGYADAQHNLGYCYANGMGVTKDYAKQRSGIVNLQSRDAQKLNILLQNYMPMDMAWHKTKKRQ